MATFLTNFRELVFQFFYLQEIIYSKYTVMAKDRRVFVIQW